MTKWVYSFGKEKNDGDRSMRNLLGGKGCNLAEMASLGLPVPPGFTITTEVCTYYYDNARSYPKELTDQVERALNIVENAVGMGFGDTENPLLVSVRSGARVSMPGMMDTVLNLGLNDETVQGLAKKSGNERFAWDSYRRFIQMFSDVVLGLDHHDFEDILDTYKRDNNISQDTDISTEGWQDIVSQYKALVQEELGQPFPSDPKEQLWGAIGAVFQSWMVPRAVTYRKIHDIPENWGTAVNVQAMVFGNMGEDCATGVAFTRDPSTGENYFYGEYLVNAQGEDVVAGIRTPQSLTKYGREKEGSTLPSMEECMPVVFQQLCELREKLEKHYRDVQDIEFTVQTGKLYMLQTRSGKRTAAAALKIAVDMVNENLIDEEEALLRIDPEALDQLLHPMIDPKAEKKVITRGLPASPGAASGRVVFLADEAVHQAHEGEKVILCRQETSPEDIHGMHAAQGIVTSRGGMTSHAAVVARGMGKPCVAGAGELYIDVQNRIIRKGDVEIREGDVITIDGSTGDVIVGAVKTIQPELSGDFKILMEWADARRNMAVRANAETPLDAQTARDFGAQGIGLCRTEHMFFDASRIQNVREMIFAKNEEDRRQALVKLLPEQRSDFVKLFTIMKGLPITIRLLDPPLHEFLPHDEGDIQDFAKAANLNQDDVRQRLSELKETNPMLGHRGCRLGITYPEIYEMQARAIFEAGIEASKATGQKVIPEIMIPLVSTKKELELMRTVVEKTAETVFSEKGEKLDYIVGTMIELPRAALTANEIAEAADFFSFGTNDLTQTTLGMSRDDAANFLPAYTEKGIFERDPFVTLDHQGVGALVEIAKQRGRETNPSLKLGICGEHGGDPASIAFCEKVGLDYVSCSPYRVPIACLAASQAAIKLGKQKTVKLDSQASAKKKA
ncbi:MAG: pyruvate, phosphate dikinase [Alphaproteobacteria bacterium]|nr:pyruvate, phosphate dikinase [Alphaproteobacteria bacterium]MCB9975864.1 pyruvate, phosphate dikinase [Rhodospirillales bacterium]